MGKTTFFLDAWNRDNLKKFPKYEHGTLNEIMKLAEQYLTQFPTDCAIVVKMKEQEDGTTEMSQFISLDAQGWYEYGPLTTHE